VIRVNGEPRDVRSGTTVAAVLEELGVQARRGVAVAVDGEVVRRAEWEQVELGEGARLEVVQAIQGG
jgi:sulfur carrier protein